MIAHARPAVKELPGKSYLGKTRPCPAEFAGFPLFFGAGRRIMAGAEFPAGRAGTNFSSILGNPGKRVGPEIPEKGKIF